MAPVDSDIANSNATPLAIIASHVIFVLLLLVNITRFLYRAHKDTPPALHTRAAHTTHRWGIALFAVLTTASLGVASYHALAWRYASYSNWADESRVHIPGTLWDGWYANTVSVQREGFLGNFEGWQLGRWFKDVNLQSETDAASIANPTGFWWTYQNFVGLLTWSVFVGIEGRHRHVSQNVMMSFILLAQFASLSTALNLFFILILLTPIPLINGAPATKPGPFLVPHPTVLSIPALLGFAALGSLPRTVDHSLFPLITSVGYFVLPILLSQLAQPNSLHKENRFPTAAAARKSYEDVFRALALASIGLHGYFSFRAVTDSAPPHRYFRHNFVWNTHEAAGNSRIEQAWAVFINIIGGLSQNPVVSQVAWDVVFSAVSLGIWAVSHGVDVGAMLRCSCLSWTLPSGSTFTKAELKEAKIEAADALHDIKDDITITSPTKRGRGRPKRSSVNHIAKDHIASSSATSTNALRRSTRARGDSVLTADGEDDSDYKPTKATREETDKFDTDEPGAHGAVKETEATALAWGLFILGGLGAVSSSVLGAETSGR